MCDHWVLHCIVASVRGKRQSNVSFSNKSVYLQLLNSAGNTHRIVNRTAHIHQSCCYPELLPYRAYLVSVEGEPYYSSNILNTNIKNNYTQPSCTKHGFNEQLLILKREAKPKRILNYYHKQMLILLNCLKCLYKCMLGLRLTVNGLRWLFRVTVSF